MKSWLIAMLAVVALMGASADAVAQYEGTSVTVSISSGADPSDVAGEYTYHDMFNGKGRFVKNVSGLGELYIQWGENIGQNNGWWMKADGYIVGNSSDDTGLVAIANWTMSQTYTVEFAGTGTVESGDLTVSVDIPTMGGGLTGDYVFNGMSNGKVSFIHNDTGAMIAWGDMMSSGSDRWELYLAGFTGTQLIHANTDDADLVPQYGWEDLWMEGLGTFSGNGTYNNYADMVVSVDIPTMGGGLTGDYVFNGMSNGKVSFIHNDTGAMIAWGDMMSSGSDRWELYLAGFTGTQLIHANTDDADLVPQYGWEDLWMEGLGTFSGNGTYNNYADMVVSVDIPTMGGGLTGDYVFNGMSNGKVSFIHNDTGAMIAWGDMMSSGSDRWELYLAGFTGTQLIHANTHDTELVPQNGWEDLWMEGLGSFSGSGTVNNTPTAITDVLPGFELNVYPNPATDFITISLNESASLSVYSATGSVVLSKLLYNGENHIELAPLTNGIYMFAVEVNGETEVIKVIKK